MTAASDGMTDANHDLLIRVAVLKRVLAELDRISKTQEATEK